MSLAVVQVCSDLYRDWLPRWAESVAALNRQPDEILIVAESLPPDLPIDKYRVVISRRSFDFADWMNQATALTTSDWIAWVGVDDAYRPTALDLVDTCEADVLALGFDYDTGQTWIPGPVSAADVLEVRGNLITCGSPFRRSAWLRAPFAPQFGPLMDWAFWAGLAATGATFAATGRLDVDYSYAGHYAPPDEPQRTQIREWAQTLQREAQ